jgi:hypothetical protein
MSLSNEQLVDFIKKNPISIGCTVLSLALLGSIYVRGDYMAAAAAQLEQKSAEADRLDRNLKNAAQLKEHLDAVIAAGKEINGRLINAENLPANNQYFYKLESETGVKLIGDPRQSAGPAKKDPKVAFVPTVFALNVQGDYAQILMFLRHLENGTAYCRVLAATCNSSTTERSPQLLLSLNLELLGRP